MVFLCIKILFARIMDVSLGTIRTMFIVKCNKIIASLIAFIEIIIWYYAAREALNTPISSIWIVISYAGGYSLGTLIGTALNEIFISGIYSIQVISNNITEDDIKLIKDNNFGVSIMDTSDKKKILFLEINKKRYKECIKLIKKIDDKAFIVINDSKIAYNGYFK